jgi:hypothetical protein
MRSFPPLSHRVFLCLLTVALVASSLGAQSSRSSRPSSPLTPAVRAALDRISADSMRGHLSFIASDLLEGRGTPSRGLDLAAEYIAAQFLRAGLEPIGDDGYFQTANWALAERNMDNFELKLSHGEEAVSVTGKQVSFTFTQNLTLGPTAIVKVDFNDTATLNALTSAQVEGKVVLTELTDLRLLHQDQMAEARRAQNEFRSKVSALKPALIASIDRTNPEGSGAGQGRLIDPENRAGGRPNVPASQNAPMITLHAPGAVKIYDALKPGVSAAMLSVRVPAPEEKPIKLRNVVGLLRGSDPVLKDTYVLLTAHYDHTGISSIGADRINNGANDNGSGTVSVIELASALTTLKQKPKRSILFMTVFGEERGLLGSRYYGRHPLFPIEKTVANVNLEQMGRTDSTEGPQIANASMTGFDFSDVGTIFQAAGKLVGINVYKHERNSDSYFGRSDNQALADQGVPAHTLCVAFNYPDYHRPGDHWEKVDFANMAKVNRMIGLGLVMIANSPKEPKWNEANPKAARYVEAWKKRRGQ